jgi:Flp pilus assembly protein TadD
MSRIAKRFTGWRWPGANKRGAAVALLLPFAALGAQAVAAQAVIQPIPDPAAGRLAAALQTLARNPQSLEALIAAGNASLGLDDLDAAFGFFNRAEAAAPSDGRAKAGLASVLARQERSAEALRLFAEAERLGTAMASYSGDRGLAYDLVGDSANAQAAYALALSLGPDDTIARRLAISQAIAGDRAASESTLLPLLQRQDLAAFRARAFALAILGEEHEAVSIAETMLPARLSSRMAPYLRYMTRLTRAQQAAAANLGRFPPAAEIGRDDPVVVAALAGTAPPAVAPPASVGRGADARLVPSGAPMGLPVNAQPAQAPPPAAPQAVSSASAAELPPTGPGPVPASFGEAVVQPVPAAVAEPVVQPLPSSGAWVAAAPEVIDTPAEQPAAIPPLPATDSPASPPNEQDLAAVFADLAQAPRPQVGAAGAVDITAIEPRRDAPRPPSPSPPPAHPSRHWVQLATGRDAGALAFDWRRIRRQAGGLLDGTKPHLAAWGDRTRLLAGPFASGSEAQELVGALAGSSVTSFRFTSSQGEQVRALD